jgi:hypothetical protein
VPNDEGNKFGFDKVIFSCDIDNIQSVYHHKYGAKADFSGYIDKFYSSNIFRLDNREIIQFWIEDKLPLNNNIYSQTDIGFLTDTLNCMMDCGVINFRNIKIVNKDLIKQGRDLIFSMNNNSGEFRDTYFPKLAPILALVAGDYELLLQKLEECKKVMEDRPDKKFAHSENSSIDTYVAKYLIPIAEYSAVHFYGGNNELQLNKYVNYLTGHISYKTIREGTVRIALLNSNQVSDVDRLGINHRNVPTENNLNEIFWGLLIGAIKELKYKKYLA